ncbi:MAG: serine/threonine-protein kinase [Terrimicrobiaceae bacterium]
MAEPVRFQHFEVPLRGDGSLHELGRGAMGITYKAFDTNLRCFVALKVINAAYLGSDVARQRFLREARAAAALRHPNVATVFHLGEEGPDCFYAMEFVDGETVEAMMKREGAIPAPLALEIVLQVSRALGAAHKRGLVHRDIKPSNLMVVREDEGELTVKVIDFGLAKNAGAAGEDAATLTVGGFLGTPHFASPEQLDERELDVRSDIYSLGVTLFYMLAGRAPFSGSLAQVMSQHLHRSPPLDILSDQPAPVVDLLGHMLAKDPSARPQTPGDLRREADACLASLKSRQAPSPACPPVDPENFETQVQEPPATRRPVASEAGIVPGISDVQASLPSITPPLPPAGNPLKFLRPATVILLFVLVGLGASAYLLLTSRNTAPAPLPSASPSPTPLPEPPPDPVATVLAKAREVAPADPAAALASLLELQKNRPDRAEAKEAVSEFLSATLDRRDSLAPEQIDALRKPLEAAAALDFASAQLLLGEELRETDPEEALKWTLAAANNGHTDAMLLAGLMLSNDLGGQKKAPQEAVKWFHLAAGKGDRRAMFALGECYQLGKGVTRDPMLALGWINKAAEQNEVHALNRLGDIYTKGIPDVVKPDLKKAFAYFTSAKDLGFPDAYGNLGVLFMNAPDMKDEKMAVEIFKQGTEKGDARSMYFYAGCLEAGLGGLAVDKAEAQRWYVMAAERGVPKAQDWCRQHQVPFTQPVRPPR